MLAPTSVVRSFRSDYLRDLARRALDQGWWPMREGSGHIRMVNPTTGAIVTLSTSAAGNGHDQHNVRAEFARAGLDLRSKAERRRERIALRRGETPPMPEVFTVAAEPVTEPETPAPFSTVWESRETIGGRDVKFWRSANGAEWASVAAPGGTVYSKGHKSFSSLTGDAAVVRQRVEAFIADGTVEHTGRGGHRFDHTIEPRIEAAEAAFEEGAAAVDPKAFDNRIREATPDEVAALRPTTHGTPAEVPPASAGVVWVAARVDTSEFPIARALDDLDRRVGPAIEALEAAGKVDAAALVRAELATTPAEAELLRLYREVMDRARIEHSRGD